MRVQTAFDCSTRPRIRQQAHRTGEPLALGASEGPGRREDEGEGVTTP
jgi:hypothetical protein